MLNSQPVDRITIAEILEHPWMNEPTALHQDVVNEFALREEN